MVTVNIRVRLRWWVRPYLTAMYLFALAVRMQPDEDRVGAMVRRGMVVELCFDAGFRA